MESLKLADELCTVLAELYERLLSGPSAAVVDEMIRKLATFYDLAAQNEALANFRNVCQRHPLHQIALQDPFTARAFNKPRGYAGDAVMLDYIYRPRHLQLSELGAAVHMMTTGVSAARSILWRRDHLGAEISKTAGRVRNGRILSVASGHLRELDIVRSMVPHRDFEIVALDQDGKSLQEAVNSNPDFNIRPLNKSISYLFKAEDNSKYDLIYSAGLFDYLPANTQPLAC